MKGEAKHEKKKKHGEKFIKEINKIEKDKGKNNIRYN